MRKTFIDFPGQGRIFMDEAGGLFQARIVGAAQHEMRGFAVTNYAIEGRDSSLVAVALRPHPRGAPVEHKVYGQTIVRAHYGQIAEAMHPEFLPTFKGTGVVPCDVRLYHASQTVHLLWPNRQQMAKAIRDAYASRGLYPHAD